MQAVILAAGESSRMYPFENEVHKSMIQIMGKPILHYTIEALKNSGIVDIIIVSNIRSSVKDYFGKGDEFGVSIKYVIQGKPEGAGNALLLAGKYIAKDFFLLNASHVEVDTFAKDLLRAKKKNVKAVLLAKKKTNGVMQGVLKFSGNKVEKIIEKPKEGEVNSNIGVVGIYLLEKGFLETLNKTPKEHYQLEAAISLYAKDNYVSFVETSKETVSLKYPWDLLSIKNYLFKNLKKSISNKSKIAKTAEIIGEVVVEDDVEIMEGVRIKGPCFIGKNTLVGNNALLRQGVNVEQNSLIGSYMEIKNTIVMKNSTTHSGFIGDSVIGENCRIAAQFCTGNVRLDRNMISSVVKEIKIPTGCKYLGVFVGAGSDIGIKVSTMPGVIIGRNVTIGPSTVVMKNVPNDTKYYTKFQEIVSKKKVLDKKPIILFDIDYTLFDTAFFKESRLLKHKIYKEVIEVLDNLGEIAILGIFSEGNIDFQMTKLKETKIEKYFEQDNTHIVLSKLDELKGILEKYKEGKTFFVDDKLSILYDAKKIFSDIFTVWVKRGPFAQNQKVIPGFKPDAEVENLSEVVRIVKSNL